MITPEIDITIYIQTYYDAFLKKNGYPEWSADDLVLELNRERVKKLESDPLDENILSKLLSDITWLNKFIDVWNECQNVENWIYNEYYETGFNGKQSDLKKYLKLQSVK